MNIQINRAAVQRDSIPFNFQIGITFLIYLSAATFKNRLFVVSSRNFSLAFVTFSRAHISLSVSLSLSRAILKNVNNETCLRRRGKEKIISFLEKKQLWHGTLFVPDTQIENPLYESFSRIKD